MVPIELPKPVTSNEDLKKKTSTPGSESTIPKG